jgi:tetratricopeptide (TPR) repeat protein
MSSLWAYVAYVRKPSAWRYVVVVGLFAAGLAAKPMVVTLPVVLLLLDIWPLARLSTGESFMTRLRALIVEKVPLVVLALAVAVVTLLTQESSGAMDAAPRSGLVWLGSILRAYAVYLGQAIVPIHLTMLYPFEPPSTVVVGISAAVLAGTSGVAWSLRRRHPAVWIGWLWYVVTLLPVSGVIPVGGHAHADRYTYVPLVGVFLMIAYPVTDGVRARPSAAPFAAVLGLLTLVTWSGLTWAQIGNWQDSGTLFRYAIALDPANYVAQNNLGVVLRQAGQLDAAAEQFRIAASLCDHYADPYINLGLLELHAKRLDDAADHLTTALKLQPGSLAARSDLGLVREQQGRSAEAIDLFEQVRRAEPDDPRGMFNLGRVLLGTEREAEGVNLLRRAVSLDPGLYEAHNLIGIALARQGRFGAAVDAYSALLASDPSRADVRNNLAFALARLDRMDEALAQWQEAVRLQPDHLEARKNLAVALSIKGRREEAIAQFREVLRIDPGFTEAAQSLAVLEAQ